MITKTCTGCQHELPLRSFYKDPRGRLGRAARCHACEDRRKAIWRQENPEQHKAQRSRYRQGRRERDEARTILDELAGLA